MTYFCHFRHSAFTNLKTRVLHSCADFFPSGFLLRIAYIFLKLHVLINTHEHTLIKDGTYFDFSIFVVSMFKLLMGRAPLCWVCVHISLTLWSCWHSTWKLSCHLIDYHTIGSQKMQWMQWVQWVQYMHACNSCGTCNMCTIDIIDTVVFCHVHALNSMRNKVSNFYLKGVKPFNVLLGLGASHEYTWSIQKISRRSICRRLWSPKQNDDKSSP
jgi:hypothetical protein